MENVGFAHYSDAAAPYEASCAKQEAFESLSDRLYEGIYSRIQDKEKAFDFVHGYVADPYDLLAKLVSEMAKAHHSKAKWPIEMANILSPLEDIIREAANHKAEKEFYEQ